MTENERELRALWTEAGIPEARQNEILAEIVAKAQPGATVGPFRIAARLDDLPELDAEQTAALAAFAAEHGRSWKAQLRRQWERASANPILHGLRNTHGPTWLDRYRLPKAGS